MAPHHARIEDIDVDNALVDFDSEEIVQKKPEVMEFNDVDYYGVELESLDEFAF